MVILIETSHRSTKIGTLDLHEIVKLLDDYKYNGYFRSGDGRMN